MFEKTRAIARKYGAQLAAIPAASLAFTNSAHAALPAAVQTALDNLGTDALEVAGIVLAAVVAVYAFKFIRKGL